MRDFEREEKLREEAEEVKKDMEIKDLLDEDINNLEKCLLIDNDKEISKYIRKRFKTEIRGNKSELCNYIVKAIKNTNTMNEFLRDHPERKHKAEELKLNIELLAKLMDEDSESNKILDLLIETKNDDYHYGKVKYRVYQNGEIDYDSNSAFNIYTDSKIDSYRNINNGEYNLPVEWMPVLPHYSEKRYMTYTVVNRYEKANRLRRLILELFYFISPEVHKTISLGPKAAATLPQKTIPRYYSAYDYFKR